MNKTLSVPVSKTLSVSAIKNGTVIDHVHAGQGLRIIHLLRALEKKNKVTVGLNLLSKRLGTKDLIKIEDRVLTNSEANEIVVFAPLATINVIDNFEVTKKINTHLPKSMANVFICRNPACITHAEFIESLFYIEEQGKQIKLICHYCEKIFDRDQVKVKI